MERENVFDEYGNPKKVKTTFWQDLTIAEYYGENAIIDTYERVKKAWLNNFQFFTEFVMVLNAKCWYYYEKKDERLSTLYKRLYYKGEDDFYEYYDKKEDEIARTFFYRVTD